MADVVMPESIPCQFNKGGYALCKKPSTNGLCSEHEKRKCVSCGNQAWRSCDESMGLMCGAFLCRTCKHSMDGDGHVTINVYQVQAQEEAEFLRSGKEGKRMLALRGVPTDIELPRHLEELLQAKPEGFTLAICYFLRIKHGLIGEFPAILKDTRVVVLTPEKNALIQVWRSLSPRNSEIISDSWMVNPHVGVAYRMCHNKTEQKQSRPYKIFSKEDIEMLLAKQNSFRWASGLIGADISQQRFDLLIQQESAA